MATPSKKTTKSTSTTKKVAPTSAKKDSPSPKTNKPRISRALSAFGGYFKGSWHELKQVHWPDRRSTWGMTLAVLLYTLFFVALIVGLDTLFQAAFDVILGK